MSYAAWLQQAESDLNAAQVLSDARHHSQAVWLAGQAVEKAHKAILVALGLRYEDKHFKQLSHDTGEISKLLPEALHLPTNLKIAEMVASLETRSNRSRYPARAQTGTPSEIVAPTSSIVDSQQDIADAKELLDWCRERIARAIRAGEALKP
jgi:HEPN domain-containing protein